MRSSSNLKRAVVSNSDALRRTRQRKKKRILLILILCLIVIIGAIVALSRYREFRIVDVTVVGSKVLPPDDIQARAQSHITGYYAWIIPKNSALFYPRRKIESDLYSLYSRIADVRIERDGLQRMQIEITEYDGVYLWCGFEYDPSAPCYFVDENGLVFDEAPFYSGTLFFKFFGSPLLANQSGVLRNPILSSEEFTVVMGFKYALEELGLAPVAFEISGSRYVYYVDSAGDHYTKIILQGTNDIAHNAENLSSAIQTEPLARLVREGLGTVEYIDLRFPNKVLFKEIGKNGAQPQKEL